jgi:hypothetical protein
MKLGSFNLGMLETLVIVLIAVIAWGVSVEVRLSNHNTMQSILKRMENLETLLTPVLVDWKVQKELEKRGIKEPPECERKHLPKMRKDAETWADDAVQRRISN